MRNHKVAIQGGLASFHDIAARRYFGEDITIDECGTFREVCEKIADNTVDFGVIAIENKIAGSILLNYHWIDSLDLHIIGELYLPLQLDLLVQPETTLEDITEVVSHPMAIGQCQLFLAAHPHIRVTEYKDTSASAKLVKSHPDKSLAVIGGNTLATTYGLETLHTSISDEKQNYTRFYILTKHPDYNEKANKASLTFRLRDDVGSLANVLTVLGQQGLNLSKIQSIPIPEQINEYAFHLDVSFPDKETLETAVTGIKAQTKHLKTLGIYESGYN